MSIKIFSATLLVCCALMFANVVSAQTEPIKVRFEIDGEEIHRQFKIQISFNGLVLEPKIENNSFVFPPELLNQEKVDVRFLSGKYNLFYEGVYLTKFNGELVFGVDNKPFDEGNLTATPPPGKELKLVYYLRFFPKDAEGTELIISVFK